MIDKPRTWILKSGFSHGMLNGPQTTIDNPDVTVVHIDDYEALKTDRDSLRAKNAELEAKLSQTQKILAQEASDNDELGAEYVLVTILKAEVKRLREALEFVAKGGHGLHSYSALSDCMKAASEALKPAAINDETKESR